MAPLPAAPRIKQTSALWGQDQRWSTQIKYLIQCQDLNFCYLVWRCRGRLTMISTMQQAEELREA